MKKYSINEFAKMVEKSPQTLRNWDAKGILKPYYISDSGYRYYSEEQVAQVLDIKNKRIVLGYCSVLEEEKLIDKKINEMENLLSKEFYDYQVISDINREGCVNEGLKEVIKLISKGKVCKLVIMSDFIAKSYAGEVLEYICELNKCQLEIVKSEDMICEEIVEEIINVIDRHKSFLNESLNKKILEMLSDRL